MKHSSHSETVTWLEKLGLSISPTRDLVISDAVNRKRGLFARVPQEILKVTYLANALSEWTLSDQESLLWLKNWETMPVYAVNFFEHARSVERGNALLATPGQIFSWKSLTISDDRSLLAGLLLLIMTFDWEAYLVSDLGDFIYLSDNHVMFIAANPERRQLGLKIFDDYGMSPKESQ